MNAMRCRLNDLSGALSKTRKGLIDWCAAFNATKAVAMTIVACFLLSFVTGQSIAALLENHREARIFNKSVDGFAIPASLGRVSDAKYFGSDQVVINIQDLHCNPEVQRNISGILACLDGTYGLESVYLEGASGPVDTSWLSGFDAPLRNKIIESFLNDGKLTGAEHYSMVSGKTGLIRGLEDKPLYMANLKRLGAIMDEKDAIAAKLNAVTLPIGRLKEAYFNGQQKKLDSISTRFREGGMENRKYYALLKKLAEKQGIDTAVCRNFTRYMNVMEREKQFDYRRISGDLKAFIGLLRQKLPYNAYVSLAKETNNFSDVDRLYTILIKLSRDYRVTLSGRFAALSSFFAYIEESRSINPLELVSEEKYLTRELQCRLAANGSQREAAFLDDFSRYLRDFAANKITSDDYEWYNANLTKFRQLYAKYINSHNLSLLDSRFTLLSDFYAVNIQRNEAFLRNFLGAARNNVPKTALASVDEAAQALEAVKTGEKLKVVVTGGFHTEGIARLLADRRISYVTITPNVTKDTKTSDELYARVIKAQSRIAAATFAPLVENGLINTTTVDEIVSAIDDSMPVDQVMKEVNRVLNGKSPLEVVALSPAENKVVIKNTENRDEYVYVHGQGTKLKKGETRNMSLKNRAGMTVFSSIFAAAGAAATVAAVASGISLLALPLCAFTGLFMVAAGYYTLQRYIIRLAITNASLCQVDNESIQKEIVRALNSRGRDLKGLPITFVFNNSDNNVIARAKDGIEIVNPTAMYLLSEVNLLKNALPKWMQRLPGIERFIVTMPGVVDAHEQTHARIASDRRLLHRFARLEEIIVSLHDPINALLYMSRGQARPREKAVVIETVETAVPMNNPFTLVPLLVIAAAIVMLALTHGAPDAAALVQGMAGSGMLSGQPGGLPVVLSGLGIVFGVVRNAGDVQGNWSLENKQNLRLALFYHFLSGIYARDKRYFNKAYMAGWRALQNDMKVLSSNRRNERTDSGEYKYAGLLAGLPEDKDPARTVVKAYRELGLGEREEVLKYCLAKTWNTNAGFMIEDIVQQCISDALFAEGITNKETRNFTLFALNSYFENLKSSVITTKVTKMLAAAANDIKEKITLRSLAAQDLGFAGESLLALRILKNIMNLFPAGSSERDEVYDIIREINNGPRVPGLPGHGFWGEDAVSPWAGIVLMIGLTASLGLMTTAVFGLAPWAVGVIGIAGTGAVGALLLTLWLHRPPASDNKTLHWPSSWPLRDFPKPALFVIAAAIVMLALTHGSPDAAALVQGMAGTGMGGFMLSRTSRGKQPPEDVTRASTVAAKILSDRSFQEDTSIELAARIIDSLRDIKRSGRIDLPDILLHLESLRSYIRKIGREKNEALSILEKLIGWSDSERQDFVAWLIPRARNADIKQIGKIAEFAEYFGADKVTAASAFVEGMRSNSERTREGSFKLLRNRFNKMSPDEKEKIREIMKQAVDEEKRNFPALDSLKNGIDKLFKPAAPGKAAGIAAAVLIIPMLLAQLVQPAGALSAPAIAAPAAATANACGMFGILAPAVTLAAVAVMLAMAKRFGVEGSAREDHDIKTISGTTSVRIYCDPGRLSGKAGSDTLKEMAELKEAGMDVSMIVPAAEDDIQGRLLMTLDVTMPNGDVRAVEMYARAVPVIVDGRAAELGAIVLRDTGMILGEGRPTFPYSRGLVFELAARKAIMQISGDIPLQDILAEFGIVMRLDKPFFTEIDEHAGLADPRLWKSPENARVFGNAIVWENRNGAGDQKNERSGIIGQYARALEKRYDAVTRGAGTAVIAPINALAAGRLGSVEDLPLIAIKARMEYGSDGLAVQELFDHRDMRAGNLVFVNFGDVDVSADTVTDKAVIGQRVKSVSKDNLKEKGFAAFKDYYNGAWLDAWAKQAAEDLELQGREAELMYLQYCFYSQIGKAFRESRRSGVKLYLPFIMENADRENVRLALEHWLTAIDVDGISIDCRCDPAEDEIAGLAKAVRLGKNIEAHVLAEQNVKARFDAVKGVFNTQAAIIETAPDGDHSRLIERLRDTLFVFVGVNVFWGPKAREWMSAAPDGNGEMARNYRVSQSLGNRLVSVQVREFLSNLQIGIVREDTPERAAERGYDTGTAFPGTFTPEAIGSLVRSLNASDNSSAEVLPDIAEADITDERTRARFMNAVNTIKRQDKAIADRELREFARGIVERHLYAEYTGITLRVPTNERDIRVLKAMLLAAVSAGASIKQLADGAIAQPVVSESDARNEIVGAALALGTQDDRTAVEKRLSMNPVITGIMHGGFKGPKSGAMRWALAEIIYALDAVDDRRDVRPVEELKIELNNMDAVAALVSAA